MKCDKVLKMLKKDGWIEIPQKGSHKILRKKVVLKRLSFPITEGRKYQQALQIE
jgi:predicted RNA binding protein YcfA (HicA-like mRNA interferase family)